jgi:hypothetical protein
MIGGVLVNFQLFLAAALFVLSLLVWLFVMTKPFYDTLRSKLLFTLVLVFGLTFLVRSFSFLGGFFVWVHYVFQLLLVVIVALVSLLLYLRSRKPEVLPVDELPDDPMLKLKQFKLELDARAKDLNKQRKGLLKRESALVKLDNKVKKRDEDLASYEKELDGELVKIKGLKKALAVKEDELEDGLHRLEKDRSKLSDIDKMREDVEKEVDALDEREASFDHEMLAFKDKLQDFEGEKEEVAIEREHLDKLKAALEEEGALLKERKRRILDAYEELDRDRDLFERERRVFKEQVLPESPAVNAGIDNGGINYVKRSGKKSSGGRRR